MNIINTNVLTSKQYNDARAMIEACKKADGSRGISFLEPEMNEIKDYPCFFMAYEEDVLVSFASVFIPDEGVCEVYANTLPSMRNRGYFTKLLELIRKKNEIYKIETMYIVNDPTCKSGTESMLKMGYVLESTDYLMRYDMDVEPQPKGILKLKSEENGDIEEYHAFFENEEVAHCYVEHNRGTAAIFGFWVEEAHRGKGYGTETLLLMLKYLINHGSNKILLHVNNANKVAHIMYFHHGFVSEEQIDYWRA